jgi:hypothetical protein
VTKTLLLCSALAPLALMASPAAAQVAGAWHVTGELGGRAFAVDCTFEPRGQELGGACVDLSTGDAKAKAGDSHALTKGAVAGDKVSWTYRASFMIAKFDVSYAGVLKDGRIAGTVTASGRGGAFTAVRK